MVLKYVLRHPSASSSHDPSFWPPILTLENRDMSCWGRGTGGDDSGIKAAEVPKTASVSPSAEQARGCQLGPRPGLAHGCNWSWGSVDVPPPPTSLTAVPLCVQGECPRHLPAVPGRLPGLPGPDRSPQAPASPGPVPFCRPRRAAGRGHSPASRAVPRLRPGEKEGRVRRDSPAPTRAVGANRLPLRQATAPPLGDGSRQSKRAAGGRGQSEVVEGCQPWEKNAARARS